MHICLLYAYKQQKPAYGTSIKGEPGLKGSTGGKGFHGYPGPSHPPPITPPPPDIGLLHGAKGKIYIFFALV